MDAKTAYDNIVQHTATLGQMGAVYRTDLMSQIAAKTAVVDIQQAYADRIILKVAGENVSATAEQISQKVMSELLMYFVVAAKCHKVGHKTIILTNTKSDDILKTAVVEYVDNALKAVYANAPSRLCELLYSFLQEASE